MNSKERILATIKLVEADRVPVAPLVFPSMVEEMTEEEWQDYLRFTDVTMTVGLLNDIEVYCGEQRKEILTVKQEGHVFTTTLKTPKGRLTGRVRVTKDGPWLIEPPVKGKKDLEKLLSIPYSPPKVDIGVYLEWEAKVGDQGIVSVGNPSVFRLPLTTFGPQALYLQMGDDVGVIEELVATACSRIEAYVEECCKQGIRFFWMGGAEHCGPGVVNPKMFRRLVTPYDKRIVALMHQYGAVVNYHVHGKLKDIFDDILELGVDILSPIETGLRGDVTLREAKERLGDRICLKGNLDDMAFLMLATEDEVRAAARKCIEDAAEGGGYMLSGTDAGLYDPRWVKSFLILSEVARAHPY